MYATDCRARSAPDLFYFFQRCPDPVGGGESCEIGLESCQTGLESRQIGLESRETEKTVWNRP